MKKSHMKKFLTGALALTLALTALAPGLPARADDPARTRYEMDVALDEGEAAADPFAPAEITVTERVTVANGSADPWPELCFRDYMASVHALEQSTKNFEVVEKDGVVIPAAEPEPYPGGVGAARLDGQALEVRTEGEDGSIVYIKLPTPLAPGGSVTLELDYAAPVYMSGWRCAFSSMGFGAQDGRTYELAQFYPMLAVYEDGAWQAEPYVEEGECMYSRCADYDLTVRLPEQYALVASGDETRGDTAEGVTAWRVAAENMRDVTLIASAQLDVLTGETGGVTVNSWYFDDDTGGGKAQGELSLRAALDAVDAFTEAYGPCPYGELDVVMSGYMQGGMEAPGLVRVSEAYSWDLREDAEPDPETGGGPDSCAATVAHEVAHQWFYAAVGNDQYSEAWLDEGFARFSEQVYWRHMGRSEAGIAAAMDEALARVPESGNVTVDRPYRELNTGTDWDYADAVYERAAGFLYRLEQAMGDEAFYGLLRAYYKVCCFREAHTEDFLSLLMDRAGGVPGVRELVQTYFNTAPGEMDQMVLPTPPTMQPGG